MASFARLVRFLDEDQLGAQWVGQMHRGTSSHQFPARGFAIRSGSVLKVKMVAFGCVETREDERVTTFLVDGAAESEKYAVSVGRIPVLHAIPMHAIGTRR